MHTLIFEPAFAGHRLNYVRLLAKGLRDIADRTTLVLSAEAPNSAEYANEITPLGDSVEIDPWLPACPGGMVNNSFKNLDLLSESIRRSKPDWIYVPFADGISQALGLARCIGRRGLWSGLPMEGLQFRCATWYPQPSTIQRVKAAASWQLVKQSSWHTLHQLDPIAHECILRSGSGFARRCRLMPDPVDMSPQLSGAAAREIIGVPVSGRYVGCFGRIGQRKGVELLLHAFRDAMLSTEDRLILAGPHEDQICSLIEREFQPLVAAGRLISINRVLPTREFLASFHAMDVVCASYPAHVGSASTVIRAAAAGRPVLGSNRGWIGEMVPRFGLGRVCNVRRSEEFADAIRQALDGSACFQLPAVARRFCKFHSELNYMASWTKGIRDALGLPDPSEYRTWESIFSTERNQCERSAA